MRALTCCVLALVACRPTTVIEPIAQPQSTADVTLAPFVEGLCPKLEVYSAGSKTFLAYGSYGLDAKAGGAGALGAAPAVAGLTPGGPIFDPAFVAGLPARPGGWIAGDVELGGRWPDALWLALVETERGKGNSGALFERRRGYFSWEGAWQPGARAHRDATVGMALPELPEGELCKDGLRFANYATARMPAGDTIVAGRCEDALGRAPGGIQLASYAAGAARWKLDDAPPNELLAELVNVALVYRGRNEAYLYAYPPYETGEAPAYLVRFDGQAWRQVPLPFEGPLVAMAAGDDGALWAITGWRTLRRFAGGRWQRVPLAAPRFVSPPPEKLRLLDVQAVAGAVWVHAAYAASLDGAAARGHALYTTRPLSEPLHCDRRRPPNVALFHGGEPLTGAGELK